MGLPQMIFIILSAMSIGISIKEHGELKTGKHSFLSSVINFALTYGLLVWGGFFK